MQKATEDIINEMILEYLDKGEISRNYYRDYDFDIDQVKKLGQAYDFERFIQTIDDFYIPSFEILDYYLSKKENIRLRIKTKICIKYKIDTVELVNKYKDILTLPVILRYNQHFFNFKDIAQMIDIPKVGTIAKYGDFEYIVESVQNQGCKINCSRVDKPEVKVSFTLRKNAKYILTGVKTDYTFLHLIF